jgi:hypothetical protein
LPRLKDSARGRQANNVNTIDVRTIDVRTIDVRTIDVRTIDVSTVPFKMLVILQVLLFCCVRLINFITHPARFYWSKKLRRVNRARF